MDEHVPALIRGEIAAFDAIYDAALPRVFGYLVRICRDRPVAEELTQECFVRLARHAPSLRGDTRILPWLYTVARNLFISRRRQVLLEARRTRELVLWSSERGPRTPLDAAESNEGVRRIERAIAALPLLYREPLLLIGVEGLSPSDVADVLGLSAEALRKRLSRGREMLRDALGRS
jgi:RNA polymerase sigma-70 factor (ECF subfamily)